MRYRADIDGLRALAVLAVVAYHAFPDVVRGAFVGVDVFFVISGFLITGIIVDGLARGTFSFATFYARRVRRIFPALATVLIACLVAGWALLFAEPYMNLGKHVAGGAGFVANFVYWREAGYFDAAAETKPLLHLWSLGVEEQFYLLWPLALFLAWRWRFSPMLLALTVLAGSLFLNLWRIRWDLVGTFYLPQTRFWEMMAGAVLAIRGANTIPERWRDAASIAGFGAIAFAVVFIDRADHFPGWWALWPVGGASLLIAAGEQAAVNRLVLARPAAVAIGLVSYPLYLWHWPLLSFARILNEGTPSAAARALIVAASAGLAWLTYLVIEKPIRFGSPRRWAVPVLSTAMAAIAGAGLYAVAQGGFVHRAVNLTSQASFAQMVLKLRRQSIETDYRPECDFFVRNPIDSACVAIAGSPSWLLWGDSHAQALGYGLRQLLPAGTQLSQVATSACDPSLAAAGDDSHGCVTSNRTALEAIGKTKPLVLILAQKTNHEATDWEAIAARARELGVQRVVLVGPAPMWKPSLPEVISRRWGQPFDRVSEGLIADRADTDRRLSARFAASTTISYVSLIAPLCDTGGCLGRVPGSDPWSLVTFDDGHLTRAASEYIAKTVLRIF